MKINNKTIHISIIIIGIIFILLGAFHTNIWFDESYSVCIANKSFIDIWKIGGHDVHPILYYWALHILNLIFGNNILAYRLFSTIGTIILGIIGYTHIRKDFGEKTGILFSFLVYFLPVNLIYSSEIRMYSWAMLLTTLMAIYAYRILKERSNKNFILFGIFSLLSAYTHYYALMTAGIINISLFIYFIIDAKKNKKFTLDLKRYIIQAVVEVIMYIPWLVYLMLQLKQVSGGFWIDFKFPDTFIELFMFQYTGNLGTTTHIPELIAMIFSIILSIYMIYLWIRRKEKNIDTKPALFAILIYGGIIVAALIMSLIMTQSILYARYMLVITGLLMFFIAYMMSNVGHKYVNIFMLLLILITTIWVNINFIKYNYDESNSKPINYVKEKIEDGDIFIYQNQGSGFVMSANFPEHMQYFWNKDGWNVEEAYKAFGPNMKMVNNLDDLKEYSGRIWLINIDDYVLLEDLQKQYDNIEVIEKTQFKTKYQNYEYTFALVRK